MKFFTTEQLGEKQSLTPEGFLLCEDVPIARTGTMIYGADEVPITASADGFVRVRREEEDVFAPKYLASLNGKSVVIRHPEEDVTPDNWKDYTVGVVLNPRRGAGAQNDLLIADLLITDAEGIRLIRAKDLREVSCGYQADYDEIAVGEGKQYNFIANHVALVEAGRCGSRCSIADHKPDLGEQAMSRTIDKAATTRRVRIADEIMRAWKAKDEEGMTNALNELKTDDEDGEHMHIHLPGTGDSQHVTHDEFGEHKDQNEKEHEEMRSRLAALEAKLGKVGDAEETEEEKKAREEKETKDKKARDEAEEEERKKAEDKSRDSEAEKAIEGELEEEAPAGTGDKARKAHDSAYLEDSFQDTISMAEILMPGIHVPTFDKAAKPKQTFDSICAMRRKALDYFGATGEGRAMVEQINGRTPDLKSMSCGAVRTLFRATAAMKKSANIKAGSRTGDITTAGQRVVGTKVKSLADLNKLNAEKFATQ